MKLLTTKYTKHTKETANMFGDAKRKKFVEGRSTLSDEHFMAKLCVRPELHRFLVATRHALASVCHVPAEIIFPEDAPETLAGMVGDWDDLAVMLELESSLGIAIEDDIPRFVGGRFFFPSRPGPKSVGEWSCQVAEMLFAKLSVPELG